MSTKTTYICDACSKDIVGGKSTGPFIVATTMGAGITLHREFGVKDSHLCDTCLDSIKDKYQDFINSIKLVEKSK